ncbi:MAG: type II secretion system protein GspG [Patescibacteria group bacterium]
MKNIINEPRGSKVVEVLFVVFFVGMSVVLSSAMLNNAREKNRDKQRILEVSKIQQALEMYYLDNAKYPVGTGIVLGIGDSKCLNHDGWGVQYCENPYIDPIEPDPKPVETGYVYSNNGRYDYEIDFHLEKGANKLPAGDCRAIPGPKIQCP